MRQKNLFSQHYFSILLFIGVLGCSAKTPSFSTIEATRKALDIAIASRTTCMLAEDKRVYCHGYGRQGQMGSPGEFEECQVNVTFPETLKDSCRRHPKTPVMRSANPSQTNQIGISNESLVPLENVKAVFGGGGGLTRFAAITNETREEPSKVFIWGGNEHGALGAGIVEPDPFVLPRREKAFHFVLPRGYVALKVEFGFAATCVLAESPNESTTYVPQLGRSVRDRDIFCAGLNGGGERLDFSGPLPTSTALSPVRVDRAIFRAESDAITILDLAMGPYTTCAVVYNELAEETFVFCGGRGNFGMDGSTTHQAGNEQLYFFFQGPTLFGSRYVWYQSQMSLVHTEMQSGERLEPLLGATRVDVSTDTACALVNEPDPTDGSGLFCWGSNQFGQAGIGIYTEGSNEVCNRFTHIHNGVPNVRTIPHFADCLAKKVINYNDTRGTGRVYLNHVVDLTMSDHHTCIVRREIDELGNSQSLGCFGSNAHFNFGVVLPYAREGNPCGNDCVQYPYYLERNQQPGFFKKIVSAPSHNCFISQNGEAHCFGDAQDFAISDSPGIGFEFGFIRHYRTRNFFYKSVDFIFGN